MLEQLTQPYLACLVCVAETKVEGVRGPHHAGFLPVRGSRFW
jgi:hypothetical protein